MRELKWHVAIAAIAIALAGCDAGSTFAPGTADLGVDATADAAAGDDSGGGAEDAASDHIGFICGYGSKNAACEACIESSCCAEDLACVGSADCTAVEDCFAGCTTDKCTSDCIDAHCTGTEQYQAYHACVANKCRSACGSGSPTKCGFQAAKPTCQTCVDSQCCCPALACTSNTECVAMFNCVGSCAGVDGGFVDDAGSVDGGGCIGTCATQHPTAIPYFEALWSCYAGTCKGSCP
jgi:hypothetical protein